MKRAEMSDGFEGTTSPSLQNQKERLKQIELAQQLKMCRTIAAIMDPAGNQPYNMRVVNGQLVPASTLRKPEELERKTA